MDAVQRFDTALGTGSAEAIRKTLPALWTAAQDAGLEMIMAELFAPRLAEVTLTGEAARIAWDMRLLSPAYEAAAADPPDQSAPTLFLASLAQGEPDPTVAASALERTIARAFGPDSTLPDPQKHLLDEGRLGEAILVTMKSFSYGADGNLDAVAQSLSAFRQMGLEDTARRAALQLLLIPRR